MTRAAHNEGQVEMRLQEFRTQDGVDVRIWRNKQATRCTFSTGDNPAKCPHCHDKVPPGHLHACEESFGGKMWSKRNEKVTVFQR